MQILAAQGSERRAIGKALERVRNELERLPRLSKYGALFKSEQQKDDFLAWAKRLGWSAAPQESLWRERWRSVQLLRRNGTRLNARPEDISAWCRQADSGEFDLDEPDRQADYPDMPERFGLQTLSFEEEVHGRQSAELNTHCMWHHQY